MGDVTYGACCIDGCETCEFVDCEFGGLCCRYVCVCDLYVIGQCEGGGLIQIV